MTITTESEDRKRLTETRRAILERKGYGYLGDNEVNDWFNWDKPDDPAPVCDGAAHRIEDTARAIRLIDKFIKDMGGRFETDSDTIIHAHSIGWNSEVTVKLAFYPPLLRKYLVQSEVQGSDKA
jgi:hypothetical protein